MGTVRNTKTMRLLRHQRARKKLYGTSVRPRLAVFRSLNHVYAQLISDSTGETLAAAGSLDSEIKASKGNLPKIQISAIVGNLIAQRAKSKGINRVVFDTGGYKYHGRIKAFAEAAREAGLEF